MWERCGSASNRSALSAMATPPLQFIFLPRKTPGEPKRAIEHHTRKPTTEGLRSWNQGPTWPYGDERHQCNETPVRGFFWRFTAFRPVGDLRITIGPLQHLNAPNLLEEDLLLEIYCIPTQPLLRSTQPSSKPQALHLKPLCIPQVSPQTSWSGVVRSKREPPRPLVPT